jgi:hypothetical protein
MMRRNDTKGYTLVELVVSMGIFTLVLGALLSVLISQNNFFSRATGRLDLDRAVRKVMNNVVKEMRVSKVDLVDIYDRPLDEGGAALDHINGRSITFQMPVDWDGDGDVFDEYGVIEWGADGQEGWSVEYCWDSVNNHVVRRVWDSSMMEVSEIVIAENISLLRFQGFTYNAGTQTYESKSGEYTRDVVEVTVTAQKTTMNGHPLATPLSMTLVNTISWRN